MTTALRSHLIEFAFLLPFLGMLALHRIFDLSDNLLAAPDPGKQNAQVYNYVMFYAFSLGVTFYIASAVVHMPRSKTWFIAKLVFLGTFWSALVLFL